MKDQPDETPQPQQPADVELSLTRVDPADLGGDPVCWAPRVCPDCGLFVPVEPPTVCPRCGALVGVD
jgi:rubrerythrin